MLLAAGLGSLFGLTGCGGGKGDVSGKVSFNGAALKGGNVSLVSDGGGPSFSGAIQEDGTYRIPDVRAGTYKVCVETESLKPQTNIGGPANKSGPPPGMGGRSAPGGPPDPLKNASKIKSGPPKDVEVPEGYNPAGLAVVQANAKKYVQIPSTYAKAETTDITFKAEGGPQTFDIELKQK